MSKFDNERVITFRVGSEAERAALGRLASYRRMSKAEVLRGLVRRALIEALCTGIDREAEVKK